MNRETQSTLRDAPSRMEAVAPSPELTKRRVLIESVSPRVAGGRYPVKRTLGEVLRVEADLIADSHDLLGGRVLFRTLDASTWRAVPLSPIGNDRFAAELALDALGRWQVKIDGWVDAIASWQHALERKLTGSEPAEIVSHLRQGAVLLGALAARSPEADQPAIVAAARALDDAERDLEAAQELGTSPSLLSWAAARPDLERATRTETVLEVEVEPAHARFGSWYEFFPRSTGAPGVHGRFRDCEPRLRYAAELGFDIVYLPPIHPIGVSFRKGKDNSLRAGPSDPGSPWAIGGAAGGHKAIHPELGTLEDFHWFREKAEALGLRVALDIALQVSPDHPYVREHPEWFVHRPDGTIQYAENPPKKYQDIYPFDFQCEDAPALWLEILSIFEYWVEQGITVFRVDNPHTKSLELWRFVIAQLKSKHPEVVLLAEAFTRPKLMYALAKLGFSQSYTYFTWRTTKRELIEYLTELTQTEVAEAMRPNFWPNTPDILPDHLQWNDRAIYVQRLILAATLSSNYGIYGPAFELMESAARPGSGEYANNEKYELRHWDVDRPDSLRKLIARVNEIRRDNPALQHTRNLRFVSCDNDALLCFCKRAGDNVMVVVVSLDPHYRQSGFIELDLAELDIAAEQPFQAHDLLGGGHYIWYGARNYVELDPRQVPAQIFRVRRRVRSEHDFDYFL